MAGKTKKKIVCDQCGKKINARLKVKKVGELELAYLWCAKCKTVYPSYVHDAHTRENVQKILDLQKAIFNEAPIDKDSCNSQEIDMRIKSNAYNLNEIRRMKKENVLMSKRLVNDNIEEFQKIGDRVVL